MYNRPPEQHDREQQEHGGGRAGEGQVLVARLAEHPACIVAVAHEEAELVHCERAAYEEGCTPQR
jgi:hypothetical protein